MENLASEWEVIKRNLKAPGNQETVLNSLTRLRSQGLVDNSEAANDLLKRAFAYITAAGKPKPPGTEPVTPHP